MGSFVLVGEFCAASIWEVLAPCIVLLERGRIGAITLVQFFFLRKRDNHVKSPATKSSELIV